MSSPGLFYSLWKALICKSGPLLIVTVAHSITVQSLINLLSITVTYLQSNERNNINLNYFLIINVAFEVGFVAFQTL